MRVRWVWSIYNLTFDRRPSWEMPCNAPRALLIGSLNPAKIAAGKTAVERCLTKWQPVVIKGVDVASGVPSQPNGDDETLLGAVNRVQGMATAWQQQQQQQQQRDEQQQKRHLEWQQEAAPGTPQLLYCSADSLLLAVEGGVIQRGQDLYCFAWAATQLAGGRKVSTARSAEFLLPTHLSQLVLGGMELGAADDHVFQRTSSGQGNGTVGILTGNLITRSAYYEHAITMALIPFMNEQLYPEYGLHIEE